MSTFKKQSTIFLLAFVFSVTTWPTKTHADASLGFTILGGIGGFAGALALGFTTKYDWAIRESNPSTGDRASVGVPFTMVITAAGAGLGFGIGHLVDKGLDKRRRKKFGGKDGNELREKLWNESRRRVGGLLMSSGGQPMLGMPTLRIVPSTPEQPGIQYHLQLAALSF